MGRLIDANSVYNAIQITTDNFGVAKHVVETNMLDMLAEIPTVEAIPKADYEAKLKADMAAILDKIRTEIKAKQDTILYGYDHYDDGVMDGLDFALEFINKAETENT